MGGVFTDIGASSNVTHLRARTREVIAPFASGPGGTGQQPRPLLSSASTLSFKLLLPFLKLWSDVRIIDELRSTTNERRQLLARLNEASTTTDLLEGNNASNSPDDGKDVYSWSGHSM